MPEQQEEQAKISSRGRFALKTAALLLVMLSLQTGIIAVVMVVFDSPRDVQADGAIDDEAAMRERPVEIEVISERFQNTRTGRSYLYETEIFVVAPQKHAAMLEERLTSRRAQIRAGIATVFRRAEPSHLSEYESATLRRQIKSVLNEHLGYDEDGEPFIDDVLIPSMTRFRGDM